MFTVQGSARASLALEIDECKSRSNSSSQAPHVDEVSSELLVCTLSLRGGGGDGDQPDWTERGKVSNGSKKRGPDARAPDWASDPAKFAAKMERDKRERGELLVAVGPFCVPCGKRFAKQTVYDAHLAGVKHLRALQRMGRDEEAMVCQLDVEAKRRKIAEAEDRRAIANMQQSQNWSVGLGKAGVSKKGDGGSGAAADSSVRAVVGVGGAIETLEEVAAKAAAVQAAAAAAAEAERIADEQRREVREEKLRQRAMLPMPAAVAAVVRDPDAMTEPAQPTGEVPLLMAVPGAGVDLLTLAADASGVKGSYTAGMQDAVERVNRFTSAEMAGNHRKLAVPTNDWFMPGGAVHAPDPDGPPGPDVPPPAPMGLGDIRRSEISY